MQSAGNQRLLCARWVAPMSGPPLKDGCVVVEGRQIKAVLFQNQLESKFSPEYVSQLNANTYDYGDAVILPA